MTDSNKIDEKKKLDDARAKRRSDELRANLMRRKAQSRARRAGEEDSRLEGIAAASMDETSEKPADD